MADHLALVTDATKKTATREATINADISHVALVEFTKTNGTAGSRTEGSLNHHVVSAATTNAANIKASRGRIHSVRIFNNAIYPVYVKFHNTAGTPTAGTGVVLTVACEAGRPHDAVWPGGLEIFTTGIGRTIVKGITDADATAVAASDCVVDVEYA